MIDPNEIKSISILDYLASIGHPYVRKGAKAFACASIVRQGADHPRHLAIDVTRNVWFDHVGGRGGSIIDLVMLHRHFDYLQALNFLVNFQGNKEGVNAHSLSPHCPDNDNTAKKVEIKRFSPLSRPMWYDWLSKRQIAAKTAEKCLFEVAFTFGESEKLLFGLGWRGRNGGWHIRTKMNTLPKVSTMPADITHLPQGSAEVLCFEGMMDYLAFASRWGVSRDVIVLNSTAHVRAAISLMREVGYCRAHLYFDADAAGDHATEQCLSSLSCEVVDHRQPYRQLGLNDVNDYVVFLAENS